MTDGQHATTTDGQNQLLNPACAYIRARGKNSMSNRGTMAAT